MNNIPIQPRNRPEKDTGQELAFYLFDVEGESGNPAQLVEWRGKVWRLVRADSDYMQAIYREILP